ncbi:MAG: hypothetical protein IKB93_15780 [Clostridia bacterium]|nr:hypothetical protein [Clostridia bacterium]
MAKKHISFCIEESDLNECEANIAVSNYKSRSDYIAEAVRFYNSYLHNKNNEEYINQNLKDSLADMLKKFENRTARLMFKQAVETSKIFWLLIKHYGINYENADTLHKSCIEEVKKINGAIQYPFLKDDKKDEEP